MAASIISTKYQQICFFSRRLRANDLLTQTQLLYKLILCINLTVKFVDEVDLFESPQNIADVSSFMIIAELFHKVSRTSFYRFVYAALLFRMNLSNMLSFFKMEVIFF